MAGWAIWEGSSTLDMPDGKLRDEWHGKLLGPGGL